MYHSLRIFAYLSFLLITSMVLFSCGEKNNMLSEEDKNLSYEVLDKVMQEEEQWVKVHAAEYKLQVGLPEGVYDTFLKQLALYENQAPYRIGIWRVLAKSAPTEAVGQQYIDKIIAVFNDTEASDRIHAAETLAKLGVPVSTLAKATTDKILKGEKGSLWVYTLWASMQGQEKSNNPMLEALMSGIEEEIPRLQAAYALKIEGNISEEKKSSYSSSVFRSKTCLARSIIIAFSSEISLVRAASLFETPVNLTSVSSKNSFTFVSENMEFDLI